jgi:hypothetical protein
METALARQTPRRSRMQRKSNGTRVELTPRDIEIFRLLDRYRYLRSTFIHTFVGGDRTKFVERLGHLYHEGRYLDRPAEQWQGVNARYQPAVYEIGRRAQDVLREHGLLVGGTPAGRHGAAQRQFAHTLMVCDILASIELAARQIPGLRFIPWAEILARAPERTRQSPVPMRLPVLISYPATQDGANHTADVKLTPDAVFGLEYTTAGAKSYRFFALEADRATMPVSRSTLRMTSYLRKILAYRQVAAREMCRSQYGIPNLLVLTVTVSDGHMRSIMRLLGEIAGLSTLFLFKTAAAFRALGTPQVPSAEMLSEPWERVGYPSLRIDHA